MVGDVRDVIMCDKFQIEIFMGYDFTGGQIFDFPIDFCMGLTTVLPMITYVILPPAEVADDPMFFAAGIVCGRVNHLLGM